MTNWLLERKMVREQGVVLMGPEPGSLIDPISVEEVREAVRERLRHWAEWVEGEEAEEWLPPLSHKAYVVETMCRALYALETGELTGKPQAIKLLDTPTKFDCGGACSSARSRFLPHPFLPAPRPRSSRLRLPPMPRPS